MKELPGFSEVIRDLSTNSQQLLISMIIASPTGIRREHIPSIANMDDHDCSVAIRELITNGLIESGRTVQGTFVRGKGDRYRVKPSLIILVREYYNLS